MRLVIVAKGLEEVFGAKATAVERAVEATSRILGDRIERQGRANLASAGLRSPRWADSLEVNVTVTAALGLISVRERLWQWAIFEKGARIVGNPLWLPLSGVDVGGLSAKKLGRKFGLFRLRRPGRPDLLASRATGQPVYVAVPAVTLTKKLSLREIIGDAVADVPAVLKEQLALTG
jgi:hypothetical protein